MIQSGDVLHEHFEWKSQFNPTLGCISLAAVLNPSCGGTVFPSQISEVLLYVSEQREICMCVHTLRGGDIIGHKYFDLSLFMSLTFHKNPFETSGTCVGG